jgi:putative ATPase
LIKQFVLSIKGLLSESGRVTILQSPPELGERLSRILMEDRLVSDIVIDRLQEAENAFFKSSAVPQWSEKTIRNAWDEAGFKTEITVFEQSEERLLTERDIENWFNVETSRWGQFVSGLLSDGSFSKIKLALEQRAKHGPVLWKWKSLLSHHVL